MSDASRPPVDKGFFAGMILALFNWLTQPGKVPWAKFLVLSACGVLGLVGAIAWDQRVVFVTVWAQHEVPGVQRLDKARAAEVLPRLIRRTGAVGAFVWELDFPNNSRQLVLAVNARGQTLLDGLDLAPIFRGPTSADAQVIPSIFAGLVPCQSITEAYPPDVLVMRNAVGASAYCVVAVNSVFGAMRGVVAAFFEHEPTDRDAIAAALRTAANELIRRNGDH